MIGLLAVATTLLGGVARPIAGDGAAWLPWIGAAWTVFFARHTRREAHLACAICAGLWDGLFLPNAWAAAPAAYAAAAWAARVTRLAFPARGVRGEWIPALAGAFAIRMLLGFAGGAPAPGGAATAASIASTAACCVVLAGLATRWTPMRRATTRP